MALKALMIRRSLDGKKNQLVDLRKKDAEFQTREAELEASINEAKTDEEVAAVTEAVDQYESEKKAHDETVTSLEGEIASLEEELRQAEADTPMRSAASVNTPTNINHERMNETMNTRNQFFGMTIEQRDAFFARNEIKSFLSDVRTCIKEKRALNNVGLIIPEVALGLLKQVVEKKSKLISRVNNRKISGTGRQRIMAEVPEAIWTEMCAKLNEMDLTFYETEVDGYKVGGFFAVCNAVAEDNDVNLLSEILECLGISIGKAVDKAIVYGLGVKMPLGVVTRLAQTAQPDNYPATGRPWKDLHSTNIITGTGKTGVALFQEIASNSKVVMNDYFDGELLWLMNKTTHLTLMTQSMDKNLNAAIVAGINNSMPVVGGDIEELPFIPDGDLVFGYFDAYLLAERAGTALGQSEHVRFIEDQTVFKGTARYDGKPTVAEAFGVMSITTKAPTTSVSFAEDKANASA